MVYAVNVHHLVTSVVEVEAVGCSAECRRADSANVTARYVGSSPSLSLILLVVSAAGAAAIYADVSAPWVVEL